VAVTESIVFDEFSDKEATQELLVAIQEQTELVLETAELKKQFAAEFTKEEEVSKEEDQEMSLQIEEEEPTSL